MSATEGRAAARHVYQGGKGCAGRVLSSKKCVWAKPRQRSLDSERARGGGGATGKQGRWVCSSSGRARIPICLSVCRPCLAPSPLWPLPVAAAAAAAAGCSSTASGSSAFIAGAHSWQKTKPCLHIWSTRRVLLVLGSAKILPRFCRGALQRGVGTAAGMQQTGTASSNTHTGPNQKPAVAAAPSNRSQSLEPAALEAGVDQSLTVGQTVVKVKPPGLAPPGPRNHSTCEDQLLPEEVDACDMP